MKAIPGMTLLALLAAASLASAADINGRWLAEFETRRGPSELEFNFKVEGDKVTGIIANMMGDSEIQDGKVEGDEISFKQVLNFRREITILYTGKIEGDEIKFTRKREGFGGPGGGPPGGGEGRPPREGTAGEGRPPREGEPTAEGPGGGGPGGGPGGGRPRGGGMGAPVEFTARRAR